jgi:tol-pal system protein YbgF
MRISRSLFATVALAAVFSTTARAQSNDAMVLLLDQVQALRSEVETLRGMVEEQGYDIRRLQQESTDRYTDLDSRISVLYQELEAGVSAAPPAASTAGISAGAVSAASASQGLDTPTFVSSDPAALSAGLPGTSPAAPTRQPGLLTEQQLYELALDSLLQDEAYQQSITQFDQYLSEYPAGRFVTNAYYWKGQAYVNLSMFEEARTAFETITTQYPDGRKIEDAMYSLGTVYHRLGDNARARQMLQEVRTRFPNTSAANLADIYLRTLN